MDAAVVEALRLVRDELAALRRESADAHLELLDRVAGLEPARAVPSNEAGEKLLAAVAAEFGEREFLAVELLAWCSPCVDQRQRDAYRVICTLCRDDDPTTRQVGMALRDLADHPAGPLRVECRGERRGAALWAVRE